MGTVCILYTVCFLLAVLQSSVSTEDHVRLDSAVEAFSIHDAAVSHDVGRNHEILPFAKEGLVLGNGTSKGTVDNTTYPEYVGFLTASIAIVFYGSNFVPVKKFETGDGMFFQWVLCAGIWLTGVILQMVRRSTFYPIVMLGGAIWATGNICVVPIIKTIGLGLGMCIWGMLNLLSGWAIGRFGFGLINPQIPNHEVMNYIGVGLAVASSFIYGLIKNDIHGENVELVIQVNEDVVEPLLDHSSHDMYGANPGNEVLVFNRKKSRSNSLSNSLSDLDIGQTSFIDRLSHRQKRFVGLGLAIFSGLLYGSNFTPAFYVMDNIGGSSQNALDYVFAQYCGIFLTSSIFFFVYCAFKRNQPILYPKVILPGLASGVMWAVATGSWFIANKALSEPVAFPIITTGPGALASLFWGVVVFKEIKGRRNILILLLAFSVTAAGAVLAGVSKG